MINYSDSKQLNESYNRCLEESAKTLGVGVEENFKIEQEDGSFMYFENVSHFLMVMSLATNKG